MAKVHAQVIGGTIKELEASTVAQVKQLMDAANYTATVNGEPAKDEDMVGDFDFIALAPQVKGA